MIRPVAIQIKTFNRPQRLLPTVDSIRRFCDVPYRLYIGDDGEVTPAVAHLYEELAREGHEVIRYPERMNVTTARNHMVSRLRDEDFLLRLDDDFNFTPETRLGAMLAILDARPEIGAISDLERQLGDGKGARPNGISDKQGHLIVHGGTLHKLNIPHADWIYNTANGVRFAYANFTRNFLLIRRTVFDRVKWHEGLVIQGEHSAFMMDLQKAGWALAFTPDSIHVHNESPLPAQEGYVAARSSSEGRANQREVFRDSYGISRIETHGIRDFLPFELSRLNLLRPIRRLLGNR